jgi:adiponectin receptor
VNNCHSDVESVIFIPFSLFLESCNVWTHLFGFLLFLFLSFSAHYTWLNHSNADTLDSVLFLIFSISAQTQMLCSTLFHLFCCVSPQVYDLTAKLDYSGIAILIVGSYFAPMYCIPLTLFFCVPPSRFPPISFCTRHIL